MKRLALGLATVIMFALTGCGAAPTGQPAAVHRSAAAAATSTAKPAAKAKKAKKAKKKDAVKAWIKEAYPGVTWVQHITGTHKVVDSVWVETDLGDQAFAIARPICQAASAYEFDQYHKFTGVSVRAASGQRLVLRINLSDSC